MYDKRGNIIHQYWGQKLAMFWLSLTVGFLAWMFYNFYWKRRGLPPGPAPLPLIGNSLNFRYYGTEEYFNILKDTYGDVYTFWFGEQPVVSIAGVQTIVDTFIKDGDSYAGRPHMLNTVYITRFGRRGVVWTDGEFWKVHRRFSIKVLRDFGMGRNIVQERVLEEVSSLIENVKEQLAEGKTEINVQTEVDIKIGSFINNIMFGYRYTKDKLNEFYEMKRCVQQMLRTFLNPFVKMCDRSPFLFRLLPFLYKDVKIATDMMLKRFSRLIEEHKNRIDFETDEEPQDYLDAFLRKKYELDKNGFEHTFTDEELFAECVDLWMAGQETTSNTLGWGLIYMMLHPEAQGKVHAELDKHIGSDRLVTLDDRVSLPYTNAVIAETQRLCNLVPINPSQRLLNDVEVNGYKIKKDTVIMHQIATALMHEENWPEPKKFRPERFLDENGNFYVPPAFMPFGVGKRACTGEGIAKAELFLFTANTFNQFKISPSPGKPPQMVRILANAIQPIPFMCHVEARY